MSHNRKCAHDIVRKPVLHLRRTECILIHWFICHGYEKGTLVIHLFNNALDITEVPQ